MKNNRVISSEKLLHKIGRVRNVVQAPDGYIYVAVENPGKVYKIVPVTK
jgi:glucose/arabinose dehydrogenase